MGNTELCKELLQKRKVVTLVQLVIFAHWVLKTTNSTHAQLITTVQQEQLSKHNALAVLTFQKWEQGQKLNANIFHKAMLLMVRN